MVFMQPIKLDWLENIKWPARCSLCWFEHGKKTEHKTAKGALEHLKTKHNWWYEARKSGAQAPAFTAASGRETED